MYIFKKVSDLQTYVKKEIYSNQSLGFVPTMGALHDGHLSLIRHSLERNTFTLCSIFVNPTQFNDPADLQKYPRTLAKDVELLEKVGCPILFFPPVEEVYPKRVTSKANVDFGTLDKTMEGAFRPGHFEGVAQVVHRLLEIVRPDELFMGQKDYQQLAIIRHMAGALNLPVEVVMVPTQREKDGLAMSSRNVRLKPEIRKKANIIFNTLKQAKKLTLEESPGKISAFAMKLLSIPGFRPEYFEIVDGKSLLPLESFQESEIAVACTAVWAGDVRLIDNMIIKRTEKD